MLNYTQQQILKVLVNNYLIDDDDYLELPADTALIVLRAIVDDEAYSSHFHALEKTGLLTSIHHLRKILRHDNPQNVVETKYPADEGWVKYTNFQGELITEKQGLLGLSSKNDSTTSPVTRQDVIKYVTNAIEAEIAVQQRILRYETSIHSENSGTEESSDQVAPLESETINTSLYSVSEGGLTSDAKEFWHDVIEMFDSVNLDKLVSTKWTNHPKLEDIYQSLLMFKLKLELAGELDVDTSIMISHSMCAMKPVGDSLRCQEIESAIAKLENEVKLSTETRHTNALALFYFFRGTDVEYKDDKEKAMEYYTKSIELNPKYIQPLFARANLYHEIEEEQMAIAEYTTCIDYYPDKDTLYKNRGRVYGAIGDYNSALQDFDHALELNPSEALHHENKGLVLQHMKKYDLSIASFNQAILLDPESSGAYLNRGFSYAWLREFEDAIIDITRAIELSPTSAHAFFIRSMCYEDIGIMDEAKRDARRAMMISEEAAHIANYNRIVGIMKNGRVTEHSLVLANVDQYVVSYFSPTFGIASAVEDLISKQLKTWFGVTDPVQCPESFSEETRSLWNLIVSLLDSTALLSDEYIALRGVEQFSKLSISRILQELTNSLHQDEELSELTIVLMQFVACYSQHERDSLTETFIDLSLEAMLEHPNLLTGTRKKNLMTILCYRKGLLLQAVDRNLSLQYLQKCIELNSNYLQAYFQLGLTHQALGNYDMVFHYFNEAITRKSLTGYGLRGYAHYFVQRYKEAKRDLQLSLGPNSDLNDALREIMETTLTYIEENICCSIVSKDEPKAFTCKTCNVRCCNACMKRCHKDHDLQPVLSLAHSTTNQTCECNKETCKALKHEEE